MSRYIGPKLRITRRLGILCGLTKKKSKKDLSQDINSEKNKKSTEYGLRLKEKQKLKFNYGLTENQLYKYIKEARRRKGVTGLILLQLLEMRLDTLCFTLGFSSTIVQARQMVNHGHITINQKVINIPSFQCKLNDIIGVKQKSTSKNFVEINLTNNKNIQPVFHLQIDEKKLEAKVLNYCERKDIKLEINELLVIEYYSRR